jgi:peptidoglycan/LPS O-acetylase OafA/YrhL
LTPAAPKPQTRDGRDYYYLFDYLRIVLAVGVFAAHASGDALPPRLGNACVQIFFALSGFLIGGILLNSTKADMPRFYFNRCTRIWVPYGIAIMLLFTGAALRQNLHDPKLWEFFFYKATFVYNLFGVRQIAAFRARMPLQGTGNHFWSICVEEQFYLVAPFLILYAKRLRVPVLLGIVAVNFVWHGGGAFATISLGVLLALSRHRFGTWYLKPTGVAACLVVLAAAVAVICVNNGEGVYSVLVGPAAAATVALVARPGRAGPLGPTLGGMSYPFYLNHWVGLFLRSPLERILHFPPFVASAVALACSLGLSFAHYQFIDRKIHERRARWYSPRRGIVAGVTAILLVVVGLSVGIALGSRST